MPNRMSHLIWYPPLLRATLLLSLNVILLVALMAIWVPSYLRSDKNDDLATRLMHEVSGLQSEVAVRKALQSKGDSASVILRKLEQPVTQADIVVGVNKLISKTDVTVTGESFHESIINDTIKQLKQSLMVRGGYKNIRALLSMLEEELPGFNVIDKVTIVHNEEKKSLDARIELSTYSGI